MSVINQVLNDLERRGASMPLHDAVRAVPAQDRSLLWVYIVLGVVLIGAIAAWYVYRQPPLVVTPQPKVSPAMVALPLAVSQVPAVAPMAVSAVATSASSVSAVIAVASGVQAVSAVAAVAPVLQPAKPVRVEMRKMPAATLSKVVKTLTLREQAEIELHKAQHLAHSGQAQEASAGYENALRIDPTYFVAREALLAALLESKRDTEAERVLQDGLALDQNNPRYAMLLARLQVERDAVPSALGTLEKTLPYAGAQADYHAFMAALLQRQERNKEAIEHYRIALRISPGSGLWLMGLAISLQAERRREEASEAYDLALTTYSLSPELQAFVMRQLQGMRP